MLLAAQGFDRDLESLSLVRIDRTEIHWLGPEQRSIGCYQFGRREYHEQNNVALALAWIGYLQTRVGCSFTGWFETSTSFKRENVIPTGIWRLLGVRRSEKPVFCVSEGLFCIDGRYPLMKSHIHSIYGPRRTDESEMMRGRRKSYGLRLPAPNSVPEARA